jgi:hypothetical protein
LPRATPPVAEEGLEGEAQGRGEPDPAARRLFQRRHGVGVGNDRQVGKTKGVQDLAHGWIGLVHRLSPRGKDGWKAQPARGAVPAMATGRSTGVGGQAYGLVANPEGSIKSWP